MSETNGGKDDPRLPEVTTRIVNPGEAAGAASDERERKGGFFAALFGGAASTPAMMRGAEGLRAAGLVALGMGLMGVVMSLREPEPQAPVVVRYGSAGVLGAPSPAALASPASSLGFLKAGNPGVRMEEPATAVQPAVPSPSMGRGEPSGLPYEPGRRGGRLGQDEGKGGGDHQVESSPLSTPPPAIGGEGIKSASTKLEPASFGTSGSRLGTFGGMVGRGFAQLKLKVSGAGKLKAAETRTLTAAPSSAGRGGSPMRALAQLQRASADGRRYAPQAAEYAAQGGRQTFDSGAPTPAAGLGQSPDARIPVMGGGVDTGGIDQPVPHQASFGAAAGGGQASDPPWSQAESQAQLAVLASIGLLWAMASLVEAAKGTFGLAYAGALACAAGLAVCAGKLLGASSALSNAGQGAAGAVFLAEGLAVMTAGMAVLGGGAAAAKHVTPKLLAIAGGLALLINGYANARATDRWQGDCQAHPEKAECGRR